MGLYANKNRRGNIITGITYLKSESVSDPVSLLCAQIVIAAVADWRELVKRKAWRHEITACQCSFNELRRFFKSDWCAFVMQDFNIEPARILEVLEEELQEAMQRHGTEKKKARNSKK